MGGSQSQIKEFSQEGLLEFNKNFDFIKKEDDPRYGKLAIYQEKTSDKYIALILKSVFESFKTNTLKQKLQSRIKLDHPNLLKTIGYTLSEDKGYCGGGDTFTIFTEWYEHDLDLEIIQRIPKNDYFSESELWYITNSVIAVCSYLEQNDVYHGDLRPMNIIMNEDGNVFVADHTLLHPLIDSWGKYMSGHEDVYFSPEQLAEAGDYKESFNAKPTYDVYKSDTFSFGMSILFAANLIDPKICYNSQKYTFEQEKLYELLSIAGNRYSKNLISFLSSILLKNEQERPTFQILQQQNFGMSQTIIPNTIPQNQNLSSTLNSQHGTIQNQFQNQNQTNAPYNPNQSRLPMNNSQTHQTYQMNSHSPSIRGINQNLSNTTNPNINASSPFRRNNFQNNSNLQTYPNSNFENQNFNKFGASKVGLPLHQSTQQSPFHLNNMQRSVSPYKVGMNASFNHSPIGNRQVPFGNSYAGQQRMY